jgi:hypothetical protein
LGNQGDDGDPFPGTAKRKHLNSKGFPNSLDYSGSSTGFSISGITWNDRHGTATVKVSRRR